MADVWGASYFVVNYSENVSMRLLGFTMLPLQETDLLKIVNKASDPKLAVINGCTSWDKPLIDGNGYQWLHFPGQTLYQWESSTPPTTVATVDRWPSMSVAVEE